MQIVLVSHGIGSSCFFFFFLQLYARRHFLFPPLSIEDYNDRVRAVVRCEAQVFFSTLDLPLFSQISI